MFIYCNIIFFQFTLLKKTTMNLTLKNILLLIALFCVISLESKSQITLITDYPNGVCDGDTAKYYFSKPSNCIIDEYSWYVNNIEQSYSDSIYLSINLNNNDEIYAILRARIDDTVAIIDTTSRIIIKKYPKPTVDIGEDVKVNYADKVYLSPTISGGTAPYVYNWMYENNYIFSLEKETYIQAETTITIKFKVIDFNQCNAYDTKYIEVEDFDDLFIPNAFCPSGLNGVENSIFYARGHNIETIKLSVYNRNGNLIFENSSYNNISEGWDGTYKGEPLNSDTFTYVAIVKYKSNKEEVKKGVIYLFR